MGLIHLVAGAFMAPVISALTDVAITYVNNGNPVAWYVLDENGHWIVYVSAGNGIIVGTGATATLLGAKKGSAAVMDYGIGTLIGFGAHKIGETIVQAFAH
jgi:hypothetical protein